jgi:5-methylcytosine-specific restriction endonuclease McrA
LWLVGHWDRRWRSIEEGRFRHRTESERRAPLYVQQLGICTWCLGRLPETLASVDIDHVIPKSLGGPDEPWNWQLLHHRCNVTKRAKLTPVALEFAAVHGVELATAAPAAGEHAAAAFRIRCLAG